MTQVAADGARMNLLILSNNPDRASFRQRVGIYISLLQSAGINCRVEKLPANYLSRWRLFKKARDFDGVFLHKKCLNFCDAQILRKYAGRLIYDFDDAVMYSPGNPQSDRSSHYRLFQRTAAMADVIIAGNSYLAGHARRFNSNVHVLPTGLDVGRYKTEVQKPSDGKVRLVWVGSKSTLKYLSMIEPALGKVGSQFSHVVLRIICDEFLDFQNLEVEKFIWSRQTEAADIKQCDIGLAPLPDNRFTRGKCGFKVLQYAAAGLPVVASAVGVNSEFVADGATGFTASDTNQWCEKIAVLIKDTDLRNRMGRKASDIAGQFNCEVIGARLTGLIRD